MEAPPTDPELLNAWLRSQLRTVLVDFSQTPTGQAVQRVGRPAVAALSEGREVDRPVVAEMLRELASWVGEGGNDGEG